MTPASSNGYTDSPLTGGTTYTYDLQAKYLSWLSALASLTVTPNLC